MKWGIIAIITIIVLSFFLFGCKETPIGYSIYNKVVMQEPSKLSFAYDAGNYKYIYLNGSEVKITLLGIEIPSSNKCEQFWKMTGISYAQENIVGRIVKIEFVNNSFVYVSNDGSDLGETLIKEGYAKAKEGNYSKNNEYISAQDYARNSKNGFWGCE